MNCGIILFIYDRPQCTKRVLESLKNNYVKELYVFQDGVGEKTNKSGWKENANLINEIEWCEVYFDQSLCKAESLDEQIINGINKVFTQKEEVIVIEDDCVISRDCIEFMYQCFDVYRNNKKIIDVSAYLEPIEIPEDYKFSVLASGIPAGWGWGTWKDRWEAFQRDYEIIKKIGISLKKYDGFGSFGYTIKKILKEYWLLGTWDLWWSINLLEKKGISIRPTSNKIHNIGFENPGTHTSGNSPWVVPIRNGTSSLQVFPSDIKIESWAELEFKKFYEKLNNVKTKEEKQNYYRNSLEKWVRFKQSNRNAATVLIEKGIKKVAIYGTGSLGELLISELDEIIDIEYFVVTDKTDDAFSGYPLYECHGLPVEQDDVALIVIPGYDIKKIEQYIGEYFSKVILLDSIFE